MYFALLVTAIFALLSPASALYFYLEGSQTRCFLEDLPKDTLVVGHFKAEEWNAEANAYNINANLGIKITVDVLAYQFSLIYIGNIRQRSSCNKSEIRIDWTIHVYCC
jgi:hypothetical protein